MDNIPTRAERFRFSEERFSFARHPVPVLSSRGVARFVTSTCAPLAFPASPSSRASPRSRCAPRASPRAAARTTSRAPRGRLSRRRSRAKPRSCLPRLVSTAPRSRCTHLGASRIQGEEVTKGTTGRSTPWWCSCTASASLTRTSRSTTSRLRARARG